MSIWYKDKGQNDEMVLSTRIRFARNLKDIKFPAMMSSDDRNVVKEKICEALNKGSLKFANHDIDKMTAIDSHVFLEKHLVSPQLIEKDGIDNRCIFLSEGEDISVMVNEEDHIRLQCIKAGLSLDETFEIAKNVDILIEQGVDYAVSEKYGYLTSCPTNTGTGLRASVMMHLPALTMTNQIGQLIVAVSKLGIAVRGFYGEGSEAKGNFYQVSNQITLNITEEETIDKLKSVVSQIMDKEKELRNRIFEQNRIQLENKIFRSYGILKYGRLISSDEIKMLISDVRLGVYLGIIKDVELSSLNEMLIITEPANILTTYGTNLDSDGRDEKRADIANKMILA